MSDAFRQKVIKTLIEEIGLLTGGRFEQFSYLVLGAIYPAKWMERGTTVEGAPRGYTVDTSTAGATLIGETSSEIDYFHGDLGKPTKDLKHAIKKHPDAKRIWLLASREATAGETTKCANLATSFKKKHNTIEHIEILDARAIAEHIFSNLESERFVNSLTPYLASIGRLADENAFSHRIPSYPDYLRRPSAEQAVLHRLSTSSHVIITGISGIGKSALAAQLASTLRTDFDIIIWLDAREIKNTSQLSDIDTRRLGTRQNISSLLRRYKCLLILDDTDLASAQISQMDLGKSKVILTCQSSTDPAAITLEDLDPDAARTLLQIGVPESCPDMLFQRVRSNVGGHPLLLVALNKLAQSEGWSAVDDCCEDAVNSIEDERHTKVCQRILLRHTATLTHELAFIKWSNTSRFDAELASICVSSRAVKNLQKRAFLAATAAGDVRVHDIVYKSIQSTIHTHPNQSDTFRDKLDQFIYTKGETEEIVLLRIAHHHASLLQKLLASDRRASFVYAVALARSSDTPLELIGDPIPAAKNVALYSEWTKKEIEIRAVVEAVEALYTLTSAKQGKAAAKQTLEQNIKALEILRASPAAKGELLTDLKHHHAKMLERLGKTQEAEAEFRAILTEHPEFAAGRLQLARILTKTKRTQEALEECKKILTLGDITTRAASAAILLETLRLISTVGSAEDISNHEPLIMSTLAQARNINKALSFRLIASIAQKTWFNLPELVLRMFDAVEWRDSIPASDSERFDWAQAHKLAAKVTDFQHARRREFLLAASDVYDTIASPNHYQTVQHAEALILLDQFNDADIVLNRVPEPRRDSFWWQRKAQALLGLNALPAAQDAINNALAQLKDPKYKPAFLHDRARIKRALLDPSSNIDLQEATALLPADDKYRKQLEAELERFTRPS